MEPLVLAVDDEPSIRRLIEAEFKSQGFRVATASSGKEALELAAAETPDLVVLDVMMPGMDGIETMQELRNSAGIPCILLTGRDTDKDKVGGLVSGADDYMVKPFNPEELAARVRAVLRRRAAATTDDVVINSHGVSIDLTRRLVKKDGEIVALTRTEWQLLQHLASSPGRIILNRDILSKVWGPEFSEELQYLRVWVSRLRAKLEQDPSNPRLITTRSNVGYKLELDED